MSLNEDRAAPSKRRGRGAQLVIATAALVFAAMVISGALSVGYAILGFAIVALVSFFALRAGENAKDAAPPHAVSERTNDPLRAIVSGLPDPVIAIDRDGHVLALNEPARALAPALRHGEPVSLALRMPELIEAVSRAFAQGEAQRIEYSERVPLDRWFEADRDAGQTRLRRRRGPTWCC